VEKGKDKTKKKNASRRAFDLVENPRRGSTVKMIHVRQRREKERRGGLKKLREKKKRTLT